MEPAKVAPDCLFHEVFWEWTHWRDYIPRKTWECLAVPIEEVGEANGARDLGSGLFCLDMNGKRFSFL